MTAPGPREAHTVREALLLEGLGNLRDLLDRLEAVDARCRQTADDLQARAAALQAGADHYAQALQRFDLAARERMSAHIVEQTRAATREALATIERAQMAAAPKAPSGIATPPAVDPTSSVRPQAAHVAAAAAPSHPVTTTQRMSRPRRWASWIGLAAGSSAITAAVLLMRS